MTKSNVFHTRFDTETQIEDALAADVEADLSEAVKIGRKRKVDIGLIKKAAPTPAPLRKRRGKAGETCSTRKGSIWQQEGSSAFCVSASGSGPADHRWRRAPEVILHSLHSSVTHGSLSCLFVALPALAD